MIEFPHCLGCVAFIGTAAWFLTRPTEQVQWQEKLVFSIFFLSAIACLGMSFAFHTVSCHSIHVGKLFSKSVSLDSFIYRLSVLEYGN